MIKRKQRFSLRKNKIGTASVLLGLTIVGGVTLNSTNVYATDLQNKPEHECCIKSDNTPVTEEKVQGARTNFERIKEEFENQNKLVEDKTNNYNNKGEDIESKKKDLELAKIIKDEATPQNIEKVEETISNLENEKLSLDKKIENRKSTLLNIEKQINNQEKAVDLAKQQTKAKQNEVDLINEKINNEKADTLYSKLEQEKQNVQKLTNTIKVTKQNIEDISRNIENAEKEKNELIETGKLTRKKLEDELKNSGPEYTIEIVEHKIKEDKVSDNDSISTPLSPENSSWVNRSGEKLYAVANENVDFNGENTETIVVKSENDLYNSHIIDYKKVSEYVREYLVELRRINGIDIPVPEVTEKALNWAKARTDEMAKNNKLSHDTVLKRNEFMINDETENASRGSLPEKSILDEKQIAYIELLRYFHDYNNASLYGRKNSDEVEVGNYGHRIPLLAASGTGFAVTTTNGYGILTFVSDNDKDVYETLPSEINPSERTSLSYFLARAGNKDGDKDRSEFYFNGKRVKFLPKTTFRYVWNETVRHRNLKRDEALNKLNEFSKKQLKLETKLNNKIYNLNNDLENKKNNLSNTEKELKRSEDLVEKITNEKMMKLQEINRLTKELDKKLEELKEVQEIQNKEEVKLITLENNLSDEKNKLELEIKDLESKTKKILELKNYKLALENASENYKKIEEQLKHLEKEYLDEKNILALENNKLLRLKEKLDFAHKCYEELKAELDKLRNGLPNVPGTPDAEIPGYANPTKPGDKAPGSSNNQSHLQRPSVNPNGLKTLPNTGESQSGMATIAGLVALAVAARLRKKDKQN